MTDRLVVYIARFFHEQAIATNPDPQPRTIRQGEFGWDIATARSRWPKGSNETLAEALRLAEEILRAEARALRREARRVRHQQLASDATEQLLDRVFRKGGAA